MIVLSATDLTPAAYIQSLGKRATKMHKITLFSSSAAKNLVWWKREKGQRDMTAKELLPSLLGWLLFRKGKRIVLRI